MKSTVRTDERTLELECSDCVLHTKGEFAGNVDVDVTFGEPVSLESMLKNLRVKLAGKAQSIDVLAHMKIDRGFKVTMASDLAPPGQEIPPDRVPAHADVFWLEQSADVPIGQVNVSPKLTPLAQTATESRGCAVFFALSVLLLSYALARALT